MTTSSVQDRTLDRRELTLALLRALEQRQEVLEVIVDSDDRTAATAAVAELLGVTETAAEAVLNLPFHRLTKTERQRIQSELEDLDAQLEWTAIDRPASTGASLRLRSFTASDADLFRRRCNEQYSEWDEDRVEQERLSGIERVRDESAAWFVAEDSDSGDTVGLVFSELAGREVDVAIWIVPDKRKQGYGTAAVKHCRRQLAAEFPGTVLVVRAPAA
ncbi:MAG: GNAT family N-acetyltransferase [Rhodococcus sp.]|nr:GNAT family N-acetyltransferase [Rhodococcus sp. (in: high G+C Gram-positive bacteria)]